MWEINTGGNTVSSNRMCLDPDNVDKLVYIKENLRRIKVRGFHYKLLEEETNYEPEEGEMEPEAD